MQLRLACWLLAALLLSAICCSAADDSKGVDTAALFNRINTTICSNNACPAGQYATSADAADCKRCPPGSYKAADGAGCCEKCQLPQVTVNATDGTFAMLGATGCGCPKGTYKDTSSSFTRCRLCPKNSVAEWGSTSCTACEAPQTPNTLRDKCVEPCPAGTMDWKGTCIACTSLAKPAANPTPGGICKFCNVGTNSTDGITCNTCLTGYFNTGDATNAVCNTCAANYFNPRWWAWKRQQASTKSLNLKWPVFCRPCPADTSSPDDNTQAKCCAADKVYNTTTNTCV